MGIEQLNDLWRVCRVVAYEKRLRLLWLLFERGELSVNQLMYSAEMTQANASIQLKSLYLAGLIRFRRQSMNVIYRAEVDERVECAVPLLKALRCCFEQGGEFDFIVHQVTAFTHERRIEIVRALADGPLSYLELIDRCGMTSSAMSRHLHKLDARKVVRWDGELYCIARPGNLLGRVLLDIVCRKESE